MAPSGKSSGVGVESVSSLILCPVVLGGPLLLVLLRVYFVILSTGKIGKITVIPAVVFRLSLLPQTCKVFFLFCEAPTQLVGTIATDLRLHIMENQNHIILSIWKSGEKSLGSHNSP